jgi:hypothetical protein
MKAFRECRGSIKLDAIVLLLQHTTTSESNTTSAIHQDLFGDTQTIIFTVTPSRTRLLYTSLYTTFNNPIIHTKQPITIYFRFICSYKMCDHEYVYYSKCDHRDCGYPCILQKCALAVRNGGVCVDRGDVQLARIDKVKCPLCVEEDKKLGL